MGAEVEVIFANDPRAILKYTKNVLACDIHTRARTKRLLRAAGAERVFGLDEILNAPVNGSGCNEKYGLLGSNKSTEDKVKLFPRDCQDLVEKIQAKLLEITGKHIEVMVYGDGAFKDPVGKIWELADPVVSPAYTAGRARPTSSSSSTWPTTTSPICPARRCATPSRARFSRRTAAAWWATWPPRARPRAA